MKGKAALLFVIVFFLSLIFSYSFMQTAVSGSDAPKGKEWKSGKEYYDLSNTKAGTIRADVEITSDTKGIIMEAGAYMEGLALYISNGKAYFQCGNGGSYMCDGQSAVSAAISPGKHVIIVTADAGAGKVMMYIDGKMVAQSDSKIAGQIAGQNSGGVGKAFPQPDHVTKGAGDMVPFNGTINSVTVWPNKVIDVDLIK